MKFLPCKRNLIECIGIYDVNNDVTTTRVSTPFASVLCLTSDIPALHLYTTLLHELDIESNRWASLHGVSIRHYIQKRCLPRIFQTDQHDFKFFCIKLRNHLLQKRPHLRLLFVVHCVMYVSGVRCLNEKKKRNHSFQSNSSDGLRLLAAFTINVRIHQRKFRECFLQHVSLSISKDARVLYIQRRSRL